MSNAMYHARNAIYRITSAALVLALAAIALTVCAGLAAGRSMWPWIVSYWAVLTAKNIVDWIGREKE